MKKINDFLEQLGLTDLEAKLYQGIIEIGPTTVKEVADHIGINRVTAHFQINELIKKGLVTQIKNMARRQIVAEPPERLEYLVEKKIEEAKLLKSKFSDILKSLKENVYENKIHEKMTIKYYESKLGVKSIYEETLKANQVHSFINLDKYYEIFPGTGDMFWNALNSNQKREVWDIAVDSQLARKISKGHNRYYCKLISNSEFFSGFDILIYDNKVAIIELEPNNTMGLIISSKMLYLSLKALHQSMWKLLPE